MTQHILDKEIIIETRGRLGVITLSRPQALNSITLEMVRHISGVLKQWESNAGIRAVFFRGAGDRAFCAGGDLKLFHRAGMAFRKGEVALEVPSVFFAEEYSLDKQIFHYPKPTIAFMDGITMGGGFGVAGNCAIRVAMEKTVFAMPEVGIGFFPDVGSMYHLLKCPDHIGRYLALTGSSIKGYSMIQAGLAEHYIDGAAEDAILSALEISDLKPESIKKILKKYPGKKPWKTDLSKAKRRIKKLFQYGGPIDVFRALAEDGSNWALDVLDVMRRRAPASIMVTAAHYERSKGKVFDEIINEDFILSQRFVERMDLYEGIRAILIERDNAPKWSPDNYDALTPEAIAEYFRPTGYDLHNVEIFSP